MGWIDKIFNRTPQPQQQPKQTPVTPAPSTAAPAPPKDQVTISGGTATSAPASSSVTSSQPSPASSTTSATSNANPNGSTPVGLPGAPSANSGSSSPTTISVNPTTGAPISESEKQAQADRLRERLHVIESVGRGISGDYRMGLEAGDAWAYDFGSNTIVYKAEDLQGKEEDYAVGVILQETGRRIYSRQPSAAEFKDNPALNFLNNAVEGPRVCNLQTSKFAGARQFFKTVYDEDLLKKTEESIQADMVKTISKNLEGLYKTQGQDEATARANAEKEAQKAVLKLKSPVPRHMQFALGMIYDWYTEGKGESPDWMRDKNAMRALATCQADFREAMQLQRDVFDKDLSPKEIIEQAKRSEDIVVNKLWPVYKQLLEMDQKDLGQSLFGNQGGQGQQSGQSGQGQQSGQSGQGQQSGQSGQGQGAGQGQDANDAKEGQGAGQGQDAKEGQGAAQGQDAKDGKQGQGTGSGAGQGTDAGVPDPKKIDTTDGGRLDDSKLTTEQKQRVEDIMRQIDQELDRKVKSREQRDREDGAGNGNGSQGSQGSLGGQGAGNGRGTGQIDLPTLQKLLEQKAQTEKQVENLKTPYEKYYAELAPLTDEMSGQLKNVLNENSDMRYVGPFRSGRKLDMRSAMQSSARYERTGMYDENIWLRRNDPSKRDYDFVFVLDESGSMMEANKWDNLLKGLIMSAEALEQLKVHFSVVGFSDQPVLHKEFKDKYDEAFREQMLAQIQRANHGGTNDSDALATALDMLRSQSSDNQKIVVMITDGQGKEQELREQIGLAARAGVNVIGVGIGDGMEYVKQVYPTSVTVDRINDLPYQLTDLIRDQIIDGLDQGR